jgi:hypothetical protein
MVKVIETAPTTGSMRRPCLGNVVETLLFLRGLLDQTIYIYLCPFFLVGSESAQPMKPRIL